MHLLQPVEFFLQGSFLSMTILGCDARVFLFVDSSFMWNFIECFSEV